MSAPFLFVASLALALVGLLCVTMATVQTLTLKKAATGVSDPALSRVTRRWIMVAIASAVLLVIATALFFYIWINCAGEC